MNKVTLNIRKQVFNLLVTFPSMRDNDSYLMAKIWSMELNENNISIQDPVYDFLHKFAFGNAFSNPESIRRCRQLIQKQNPELRGKNYELRHKKAQKMKEELMPGLKTL